jgi:hypothetical protein
MSHEGGSEQSQRTVAELLAKYGAETGERAPRRRRRRADDISDTGAQAIIDRVMSESGEMQVIREDQAPPERTSHRHRTDFQRPVDPPQPPPRRGQAQQPSQPLPPQKPPPPAPRRRQAPQPSQQLPTPGTSAPTGPGNQSSARLPAIAQSSDPTRPVRNRPLPQRSQQLPQPSQQLPVPPPVPGGNRERSLVQPSLRSRLESPTDSAPSPPLPGPPPVQDEPTTEEMPRVPHRIQVDGTLTGRRPVPGGPVGPDSRTQLAPVPYPPRDVYGALAPAEPEEDYRSGYPNRDPDGGFERDGYDLDELDDDLDDLDDRDDLDDLDDRDLDDDDLDDEDDVERSPAKEWLIMISQIALGVVVGAAVWLGFQWLWGALPAAALVLALAVIAGLVLVVRKIRKAEDLQTTVYAVLVGLMVTVTPAALLLLKR